VGGGRFPLRTRITSVANGPDEVANLADWPERNDLPTEALELGKPSQIGDIAQIGTSSGLKSVTTPNSGEDTKSGYGAFHAFDLYENDPAIASPTQSGQQRGKDDFDWGHFGASRGTHPHRGGDFEAAPGEDVYSLVDGTVLSVTEDPYPNDPKKHGRLTGVQILTPDGRIVRMFYVKATQGLQPGTRVSAGQPIGTAEDVAGVYADLERQQRIANPSHHERSMTNHVHVEVWNPQSLGRSVTTRQSLADLTTHYVPRDPFRLMKKGGP
jgi:murein DD-endopeptidase MepM/ murein hydrolase activator NlpD